MKQQVERASQWIYSGLWAVLVRWFRVPDHPPTLPGASGAEARSFRPAEGFLRYLKFFFWFALVVIDGAIFVGWLAIMIALPWLGALLALPALALAVLPDVVAYIAIHLRYDTTWYVISSRSMRIRRGIWILHETTITYENIQNIRVTQGPLQRYFGIGDVIVETAGGGSGPHGQGGGGSMHVGLIEGVDNAPAIRDLILGHLRQSRTAGLGDEHEPAGVAALATPWTGGQLELLREIRDAARALST